jgi:Lrp/AsnC family leucine-responsive transcriptional regulator
MTIDLDRIDRKIVAALATDGRMTITALAQAVGLSKTPCAQRLKRLEERGIILGYAARLDHAQLGQSHIAFVQVSLTDTKAAALETFNKAVLSVPEIEQCHMIAGSFDYLLKVRSRDISDYRRVLAETISSLPFVSHTSTYVAMEAVKE